MSLLVRFLSNGRRAVVAARYADVTPVRYEAYTDLSAVPRGIRHLVPDQPDFAGPGLAGAMGVGPLLYPGLPLCPVPGYQGQRCIGEYCKYYRQDLEECDYQSSGLKSEALTADRDG